MKRSSACTAVKMSQKESHWRSSSPPGVSTAWMEHSGATTETSTQPSSSHARSTCPDAAEMQRFGSAPGSPQRCGACAARRMESVLLVMSDEYLRQRE